MITQLFNGTLQFIKAALCPGQQLCTLRGEPNGTTMPVEQRCLQRIFQRLDLRAYRRRRHIQLACRIGKAEMFGHRYEHTQCIQR